MKLIAIAALIVPALFAQDLKLPASLDRLAAKASEVVDVTLDASTLQLATRFLSDKDADQAKAKKIVSGLKGIYVKSYEFEKEGEYLASDLESVRSQLHPPLWTRIVNVRSTKKGENADVFLKSENGQITGLAVLAAEPKQLTIVNIVGNINPEQLQDLGGNFGIPKMKKTSGKED